MSKGANKRDIYIYKKPHLQELLSAYDSSSTETCDEDTMEVEVAASTADPVSERRPESVNVAEPKEECRTPKDEVSQDLEMMSISEPKDEDSQDEFSSQEF